MNLILFYIILSFGLMAMSLADTYAESSAELYKTNSYQYGKFEASIKFAPGSGVVSTFFLWKNGSENTDTFWNEVDIEKVAQEEGSYYLELSKAPPMKAVHPGYRYYRMDKDGLFGLYCGK